MKSKFLSRLQTLPAYDPPADWRRIRTIDLHTEGEPLRVILSGFPELEGSTILEYRQSAKQHWDHLRTALMWEPRGHADMYGCLLTPPVSEEADFGVLFLHNEGYSTMCGHAIIALATMVVELGLVDIKEPETQIKIDTPAGMVTAYARVSNGRVTSAWFYNVPSFVVAMDQMLDMPGFGQIKYDLAFGGAFYAYVDADELGIPMVPENYISLIKYGMAIKHEVNKQHSHLIQHPFEEDLSFLYGTIFTGRPVQAFSIANEIVHSRHVCIFAEGEVDRSPTGTGVSGRIPLLYKKGLMSEEQTVTIESILGTKFHGSIGFETTFGPYDAIIPKVEGRAYITGQHEFLIDPNDPLKEGFILR